ncbi:MAG: hypothetical protein ABSH12_07960 [Endomicrobiales bacterium]|jgi:Tfp pilus assembly protein PilP
MQLKLIFVVSAMVFCAGCSQDDIPEIAPSKIKLPVIDFKTVPVTKAVPRYDYGGDRFRDPFVPFNPEGPSTTGGDEVKVPNIGSLTLKGIMADGNLKIAIISGGAISYVLKGKYLYDNHQRLVRGITGIINDDSVIIIAPDKSMKEIRLRGKQ